MEQTAIKTEFTPKEITVDVDYNEPLHLASFSYYDGIEYAKSKELRHTTTFRDVFAFTHYIVACGDVMIRVKPEDFPEIPRREI